eukprot:gene8969-10519_t
MSQDPSWPNASNTGVIPGTILTEIIGGFDVKIANTVIENKTITGCVKIKANNVTIRNTRIYASENCGIDIELSSKRRTTGHVFENIEVDGSLSPSDGQVLVGSVNYDSYVHDQASLTPITHKSGASAHGGDNIIVKHNVLTCNAFSCSAALAIYNNFDNLTNVLVENNVFTATGAYCVYGGNLPTKPYFGFQIRFIGNHFMTTFNADCGTSGPVSGFLDNQNGNIWDANVWDFTTQPPFCKDARVALYASSSLLEINRRY